MRRFKDTLITFILIVVIIIVFSATTCICLEFFGIIELPEEYSLINLFYSKAEVVSSVQSYVEDSLKDKRLKDIFNKDDTIVVELDNNSEPNTNNENNNLDNTENQLFRYYDQLDTYSKTIYNSLDEKKEKLKTGDYTIKFGSTFSDLLQQENGSETLNNSFQLAVNAFSFDHPEIFYIDITKIYLLTEITTKPFSKTYKVSIGPNEGTYLYEEYKNENDVNSAISKVEEIRNQVIQNAQGNEYDKVKYVHDFIIDNVEYEKNSQIHNNYNIYGTLINKQAVCEGYAKTVKYMLDEMNIPCYIACGTGKNSSGETESHAWNYVRLNNNWYAVDTTWDDPIIIGSGRISESTKYKYFLKGSDSFFKDHFEDGRIVENARFTYPEIAHYDF